MVQQHLGLAQNLKCRIQSATPTHNGINQQRQKKGILRENINITLTKMQPNKVFSNVNVNKVCAIRASCATKTFVIQHMPFNIIRHCVMQLISLGPKSILFKSLFIGFTQFGGDFYQVLKHIWWKGCTHYWVQVLNRGFQLLNGVILM